MTIARCMEFRLRLRTDVSGFPCECAQATMPQLIKSYLVSYLANFAGSLLLVRVPLTAACLRRASVGHTSRRDAQDASPADAASVWCELRTQNSAILVVETDASRRLRGPQVFMVAQTGLFGPTSAPVGLAMAKTSLTFSQAFFRGVLCNFLVCIAIVQASSAQDFAGKAVRAPCPVVPTWRQWGRLALTSRAPREDRLHQRSALVMSMRRVRWTGALSAVATPLHAGGRVLPHLGVYRTGAGAQRGKHVPRPHGYCLGCQGVRRLSVPTM